MLFLAILAAVYGISLALAAARGGSNPHSDDPCSRTYEGPPAPCAPFSPSGHP